MKVLLTGATGTFGKAFLRRSLSPLDQAASFQTTGNPLVGGSHGCMGMSSYSVTKLAAFARSESRLSNVSASFSNAPAFRAFLGDVRDKERLKDACDGIDVIVHAAALKRVDDGSYNPSEMIQTNIVGTQNVIRAGLSCGVSKIVIVSSDKAVAPINVYGGTKFVSEQFSIAFNSVSIPRGTKVSCVRYGNVLGSTGSVLTLWDKQREDGVIKITDGTMTRFWMSVDDAVSLVFSAIHHMQGGEIFIPALRSSSIEQLAHAFAPECELEETGRRVGGEKVHEHLLSEDECRRVISRDGMIVIPPGTVGLDTHWDSLSNLWDTDSSVPIPVPYTSESGGVGDLYSLSELHELLVRITADPYV